MSLSRYPWHRGISPIGLDFGSDQLRALQLRTGPDAPEAGTEVADGSDEA